MSSTQTLALGGPAISILFGLCFLAAWMLQRGQRYLLSLSACFALYGCGAVVQIVQVPSDIGLNAMISAAFYTSSVIALSHGVLRRVGESVAPAFSIGVMALIMAATFHFFYIDRNLLARVYLHNIGLGAVLLLATPRLYAASRGKPIDMAVFWIFTAFALSFFPRTLISLRYALPDTVGAFGTSVFWLALQLTLLLFGFVLALTLLLAMLLDRIDRLQLERDVDLLTQVFNRRGLLRRAQALLADAQRRPLSIVACDIDHFKAINDTFGHEAGDAVLKAFGALLRGVLRQGDIAGRVGGEEFLLIFPNTELAGAAQMAERLRIAFAGAHASSVPASGAQASCSFGVVEQRPAESLGASIARADRLLYQAKREGRNRVIVDGADATAPLLTA